jgi:hypothetical protein
VQSVVNPKDNHSIDFKLHECAERLVRCDDVTTVIALKNKTCWDVAISILLAAQVHKIRAESDNKRCA